MTAFKPFVYSLLNFKATVSFFCLASVASKVVFTYLILKSQIDLVNMQCHFPAINILVILFPVTFLTLGCDFSNPIFF